MRIVLDTNIVLVMISKRSPFRWVFDAFLEEKFTLCVTTDILDEYAEIIENHIGVDAAQSFLAIVEEAENVAFVTKYFYWNLIKADPDDDKFVDCAIACNANFIVSEDKHFRVLKQVDFPKINVLTLKEFEKKL